MANKKNLENAVIHSIMNGFPLNVMYWSKTNDNMKFLVNSKEQWVFVNFIMMIEHMMIKEIQNIFII